MNELQRGSHKARVVGIATLGIVLSGSLVACGSGGQQGTASNASGDAQSQSSSSRSLYQKDIAALLPARVRRQKTLDIPTDATYPPDQFETSSKQIVGLDPDLGHALGQVLGLKFKFVDVPFDSIIPGISSGKWLVSMTADENTPEREKVVDFVTAWKTGLSFMTSGSSSTKIENATDACGLRVGVNKGNIAYSLLQEASRKCVSQGKKPMQLSQYPGQNAVNLAVKSGRLDATSADEMTLAYTVQKTGNEFKLQPYSFATATEGIVLRKKSGLAQPVLKALKYLISSGKYSTIFHKWNVARSMIDNPAIYPASSR